MSEEKHLLMSAMPRETLQGRQCRLASSLREYLFILKKLPSILLLLLFPFFGEKRGCWGERVSHCVCVFFFYKKKLRVKILVIIYVWIISCCFLPLEISFDGTLFFFGKKNSKNRERNAIIGF